MRKSYRRMPAVTLAALLAAAAAATPIPQGPNAASLPAFTGHAVRPQPLAAPARRGCL
jgi:hypothetical protein